MEKQMAKEQPVKELPAKEQPATQKQIVVKAQPQPEQVTVAADTSGRDMFDAANDGDCARMLTLLDAGAEADEMAKAKDMDGNTFQTTALIEAVGENHEEAVNLLLDHRADSNLARSEEGFTPLMGAAQCGRLSMLDTLLQHGANIDAVDEDGDSAFHFACFQANADCAEVLAKHGCDVSLRNEDGHTGVHLASMNKHRAAVYCVQRVIREKEQEKEIADAAKVALEAEAETVARLKSQEECCQPQEEAAEEAQEAGGRRCSEGSS